MSTIENRLRVALAARAMLVTADGLQPALPPTLRPARRSWRWLALVGATLAVVVLGVVVTFTHDPVRPEQPSSPVVPSPSAPATSSVPAPAPSAVSQAASPTATPVSSSTTQVSSVEKPPASTPDQTQNATIGR
jgi:hypothetical protein